MGVETRPEIEGGGTPPAQPGRAPASAQLVRLGLIFYAGLAFVAVLWRTGLYGESLLFASPAAAARGLAPARDVVLGAATAGAVVLLSRLLTRRTRQGRALARGLAHAVGRLSLSQCLLLALVSGVAEEAFFRGALQPRVGLLAASVLFALAHFVPRRDLALWSGFSLAAGLLLGVLFEATGNLVAPAVAHVVINAANLPYLVREYGPRPEVAAADRGSAAGARPGRDA